MASRESDSGAPAGPANDSIDELLDGLPAEPMLPKKRARSIEEAANAAAPKNRRADDKVIVSDDTDPRERARVEAERERRASSTFGTSFLEPNLNWQKAVVGVVVMLAVLGIYAFVRTMKKNATPPVAQDTQSVQITSASAAPTSLASPPTSATTPLAGDPVPPPSATAETKPAAATTMHHLPLRAHNAGDQHAPTSPAPSSDVDNLFKQTR